MNESTSMLKLDFLPDENVTQEDSTLYTVDHDILQPLNVPFMMPGIYKKIEMPIESTINVNETSNVIITRPVTQTGFRPNSCQAKDFVLNEKNPMPQNQENFNTNENLSKKTDLESEPLQKLHRKLLQHTNCENLIIDKQRNELVRLETNSSKKTIFRIVTPMDLELYAPDDLENNDGLHPSINEVVKPKNKIGRPRKQATVDADKSAVTNATNKLPAKPTKLVENATPKPTCTEANNTTQPQRTRSGRLITLKTNFASSSTTQSFAEMLADLKDSDYQCKKAQTPALENTPSITVEEESSTTVVEKEKRHVPPESICVTCKKIFLGKRMQRHLAQHPDHIKPPTAVDQPAATSEDNNAANTTTECSTLFGFLINKLHKNPQLSEDQRADLFLNEIDDFVNQLQLRSSRLIHNTSGLHFVSTRSSRVLGIPEGQYALDLTALEAQPETDSSCLGNFDQLSNTALPAPASVNTRSLDYTAISLDDTLTDEAAQKLNLSAGGKLLPPSEESLLRAVDDLVHSDIKKLNEATPMTTATSVGGSIVPHYDHVSDNAVEAVTMKETKNVVVQASPILDLSVEFFQFNNN